MQLVRYDAACQAIAEAKAVDEVKTIVDQSIAIKAYARQAKNKQLEVDAAEIRIRAERRLGEIIRAQKETVGLNAGGWTQRNAKSCSTDAAPQDIPPPTLADAGIDKKLSSRAQKIAAVPEEEFEGMLGDWRERVAQENERVTTNLLNRGTDVLAKKHTGDEESYTPAKYVESARTVMGAIDLDPASNDMAQETVKAATYYTIDDDGLTKDWRGRVWMNPPYTALVINRFIEKLTHHFSVGDIESAIVLTNNNTDTSWFHIGARSASAVCFTAGRINFLKHDGATSSPTNGQAFFYFGPNVEAFKQEFSTHGLVMVKA